MLPHYLECSFAHPAPVQVGRVTQFNSISFKFNKKQSRTKKSKRWFRKNEVDLCVLIFYEIKYYTKLIFLSVRRSFIPMQETQFIRKWGNTTTSFFSRNTIFSEWKKWNCIFVSDGIYGLKVHLVRKVVWFCHEINCDIVEKKIEFKID